MRQNSVVLLVMMLAAIFGVAFTLAPFDSGLIRIIFALLLVLVLPGYALLKVMFPGQTFGMAEQLLFSVGMSLVLTIIAGILLHFTPWGLQPRPWAVLLGGITFALSGYALFWMPQQPDGIPVSMWAGLNLRHVVFLVLAGAVTVVALGLARTPVPSPDVQGYSLLWLLPNDSSQQSIRVGISSQEFKAVDYRLTVTSDNQRIADWSPIKVQPGTQWEITINLTRSLSVVHTIEATLYRLDNPQTVYRHVTIQGDR